MPEVSNVVATAAQFAEVCHRGQRRKWVEEDYIRHPARVATAISMHPGTTDAMIAAAWCHDVIEDCEISYKRLELFIGTGAADLVQELTNPSKSLLKATRAEKKAVDLTHLARISDSAKKIKLVDRRDNLLSVRNAPEDFIRQYMGESRDLLAALRGTDRVLEAQLQESLAELERWYEYSHG